MERVAIIGPGGAGKSTLARKIGESTGLPVIHLDREHWRPGWVETPRGEWESRVRDLAAGERWIIDGNYGGTLGTRLERANTIVFLDFGRCRCLRGAITRRIRYRNRTRPDMTEGCKERLTWQFLKWIWDYPKTKRPGIVGMLAEARARGTRVVILRDDAQVDQFVRQAGAAERPYRGTGTRMLIVGAPGAGKTSLGRQVGAALGIQPVELDAHLWADATWEAGKEAKLSRIEGLASHETWIIDGEYLPALGVLLRRATTVVHLAVPYHTALRRRMRRGDRLRGSIAARSLRSRVKLWTWLLAYPFRDNPAVSEKLARSTSDTAVFRLTNDREITEFLGGLGRARPDADAAAPKR